MFTAVALSYGVLKIHILHVLLSEKYFLQTSSNYIDSLTDYVYGLNPYTRRPSHICVCHTSCCRPESLLFLAEHVQHFCGPGLSEQPVPLPATTSCGPLHILIFVLARISLEIDKYI